MKIKIFVAICFVMVISFYLFSDSRYQLADVSENRGHKSENNISLIVTGDVLLARTVNYKMVKTNDFTAPFAKTAGFLKSADLTLVNLETPLVQGCPLTNDGMIFCGDPRGVLGLKYAGVDLVGIANNHILNQGAAGKEETVKILEENNLKVLAETKPVIIEIKGQKLTFLAYDTVTKKTDFEEIKRTIQELKNSVNFIIMFFHWGTEYTANPNNSQIELAHFSIDSGADLILGNHPHWAQTTEKYKDKLIVYSHGNFVFDQMWSDKTRTGVVGKYIIDNKGLKEAEFYPVLIEDYWQPRFTNNIE